MKSQWFFGSSNDEPEEHNHTKNRRVGTENCCLIVDLLVGPWKKMSVRKRKWVGNCSFVQLDRNPRVCVYIICIYTIKYI